MYARAIDLTSLSEFSFGYRNCFDSGIFDLFFIIYIYYIYARVGRVRHGRDRYAVGLTTTCTISAYHH
jgi:hypothetical protein